MNVSMHMLAMWGCAPDKTRHTDFFLFFQLFDFHSPITDSGSMKKHYAGLRPMPRLLTGS